MSAAGTATPFSNGVKQHLSSAFKFLIYALNTLFIVSMIGFWAYAWFGSAWATREINEKLFGQCVDVGGAAVGRVIWVTPSLMRGAPWMNLDDNFRPVAHGLVKVKIGETTGTYDASALQLTPCTTIPKQ